MANVSVQKVPTVEGLMSLATFEDFQQFGLGVLDKSGQVEFQKDLRAHGVCCAEENFWTTAELTQFTKTGADVQRAIEKIQGEPESVQALHRLQLLATLCPAVGTDVEKLLQKLAY